MRALLLAASAIFLPFEAAGQSAGQGTTPAPQLSLLDVPYLSQSEALCGGAAAAMVLRYWGAKGVAAEDFASLVDRSRGGIAAAALARAVEERGYDARPASGTPAIVSRELAEGRPVIALIEDRPDAYHYVVVVGWHDRAVVLHDPARTPYVLMKPAEFERRWRASRNWLLAVAPARDSPVQSTGSESRFGEPVQSTCHALVADGVRLARQNDLMAAERLLAGAAYQCRSAAPLRELAGVRLLQRRWPEVRELAGRAVQLDPADTHAWRLLATARYVEGDHLGALDAWNRAAEPSVDIVSVSGLERTSHRAVERLLDISPGEMLTRSTSERARRRLDELPAAAMTRLEYVPRPSGTVELRAHVLERGVVPRGRLTWAGIALHAAASREVVVPLSAVGRGGERVDVGWRFWPNRPAASVALHAPAPFGLFSLDLVAERQPFNLATLPDAQRVTTHVRAANWATPFLRWEARGGFARWRADGSYGAIGGGARLERARVRVDAEADAWLGDRRFAAGSLRGGWRSSTSRRGLVLDLSAAVEAVSRTTPLDLWPAGDTGHARRLLLRAHPVLEDGRLRAERLGRHVMQATIEAQHWWRAAAVPVGAAIFLDTARTARHETTALADADVGAGVRLSLPGRQGTLRADIARGLRDGNTTFSMSWAPE